MQRTVCTDGVVRQGKGKDAGLTFLSRGQQIVHRVNCLHLGAVLPHRTAFFTEHFTFEQAKACQGKCNNACGAAVV